MGELRESHNEECGERVERTGHTVAHWRSRRHMDGERRGAHADLLWRADHTPRHLPCLHLCHLRLGERHDRLVVDNHCDHRHSSHGHWTGAGLWRRMGGRSHYQRSLLWRQDLAAERDHHSCLGQPWRASVQAHSLHARHNRAVDGHHAHSLLRRRSALRHQRKPRHRDVHTRPRRTLQHHAVAAARACAHGCAHCTSHAARYNPLPLGSHVGGCRTGVSGRCAQRHRPVAV